MTARPNGSAIRTEDKPHAFTSLWAKTSVISDIVNFLVNSECWIHLIVLFLSSEKLTAYSSIFTVFSEVLILLAWNKGDKYHRDVDQD